MNIEKIYNKTTWHAKIAYFICIKCGHILTCKMLLLLNTLNSPPNIYKFSFFDTYTRGNLIEGTAKLLVRTTYYRNPWG